MNVDPLIVGASLSAIAALQAWTLKSLVRLQEKVAVLTERIDSLPCRDRAACRKEKPDEP